MTNSLFSLRKTTTAALLVVFGGLTSALRAEAVSSPSPLRWGSPSPTYQLPNRPFYLASNPTFVPSSVAPNSTSSVAANVASPRFKAPEATLLAKALSYNINQTPAATLYLQNLPVVTFLAAPDQPAPQLRADTLAMLLNRLTQNPQANRLTAAIQVAWNGDRQSYDVSLGNQLLVSLDRTTRLVESTGNMQQDAVQIADRLRRFLGTPSSDNGIAIPVQSNFAFTPTQENRPTLNFSGGEVVSSLKGLASWYGPGFHGRRSANGERFDQNALTAAHKTLPFGTLVRVTNLNNGTSVVVRINDRGPYAGSRVIDLSRRAAQEIGMLGSGVANVKLEILR